MLESLFLKETSSQVYFCEYWEIFKSTYFEEHLRTAVSVLIKFVVIRKCNTTDYKSNSVIQSNNKTR